MQYVFITKSLFLYKSKKNNNILIAKNRQQSNIRMMGLKCEIVFSIFKNDRGETKYVSLFDLIILVEPISKKKPTNKSVSNKLFVSLYSD